MKPASSKTPTASDPRSSFPEVANASRTADAALRSFAVFSRAETCAVYPAAADGGRAEIVRDAAKRPAPLRGENFRNADLRGRTMIGRDCEGADFEGADLRDADLRGADLFGARFRRSDLRGAAIDMTRLFEIWVPRNLPLEIANQIRAFDFRLVMKRLVTASEEPLPCPYRDASVRPVLYEWGSRTWNGGRGWREPATLWTLEEIAGAVLSALECRHDLELPIACR
jgi:hypothetical protein